jgi:hypothetical protein
MRKPALRREQENAREKPDSILAYLIRDLKGRTFMVECVDISEYGLVFSCDPDLVQDGLLPDYYIDSRYFKEWGFILIIVPNPPDTEQ